MASDLSSSRLSDEVEGNHHAQLQCYSLVSVFMCARIFRHTCSCGRVHVEPDVNLASEAVALPGRLLPPLPLPLPLVWDYKCILLCYHI